MHKKKVFEVLDKISFTKHIYKTLGFNFEKPVILSLKLSIQMMNMKTMKTHKKNSTLVK